jgi:hypothetical protein
MHFTFSEVLIRLKPQHARTLLVNSCSSLTSDLTTLDVWVFRMTSTVTRHTWALHLSGAQYHKPDIATFWDDFVHDHVASILSTKPSAPYLILPMYKRKPRLCQACNMTYNSALCGLSTPS